MGKLEEANSHKARFGMCLVLLPVKFVLLAWCCLMVLRYHGSLASRSRVLSLRAGLFAKEADSWSRRGWDLGWLQRGVIGMWPSLGFDRGCDLGRLEVGLVAIEAGT